ncbi:MAG: radical SAM protein [Cyanobacteria bacterium SIG29]|nr:radical SAM protein [Cyanobacteria bacterium SIG29]
MTNNNHCKFLVNSLSFHQLNVRFCTTLQLGEIISTYQEKNAKELAQKITDLRCTINENLNQGIIPEGCKNCIYKNNEEIYNDKIQRIDLYYWYHCNCGCFYCSYRDETKGEFSDREKEGNPLIYNTLKELYNLNQIDKDHLIVCFGGGELGVLKEFPKLIDLFMKNNVEHVICESSGIKYSKAVEKLLKNKKGTITVAVCAGSRETYKKIKNRDKYNQVMKNLKNYVKAASSNKTDPYNALNVVSKYIILKGFNDNIPEVENWLLESKKYGLKHVEISMEFCWGIHTKSGQKIEDYNYEIFEYVEKRCKELQLELRKNTTSMALMEQGVY